MHFEERDRAADLRQRASGIVAALFQQELDDPLEIGERVI
jgi:hypothetical protein